MITPITLIAYALSNMKDYTYKKAYSVGRIKAAEDNLKFTITECKIENNEAKFIDTQYEVPLGAFKVVKVTESRD